MSGGFPLEAARVCSRPLLLCGLRIRKAMEGSLHVEDSGEPLKNLTQGCDKDPNLVERTGGGEGLRRGRGGVLGRQEAQWVLEMFRRVGH